MNLRCRQCGRWLGRIDRDISGLTIKCGNCKANNTYTIKFASSLAGFYCYNNDRAKPTEPKGQAKTGNNGQARE